MKLYYIVEKTAIQEMGKHFIQWHAIDLPSGKVLLCGVHTGETAQVLWEGLAGVSALPHPLSGAKLSAEHVKELAHLGVKAADATFHVGEKAAKAHPLLRFTSF